MQDLGKLYPLGERTIEAVGDVSFEVTDGEFVALIGPSGCGKSTILNMLAGLARPTRGRVLLDGQPVQGIPPNTGYVFQKDTVYPWRTVAENIALGLEYRRVRPEIRQEKVTAMVRLAGLEGFEHAYPATLSGGMRQRAALMRSLVVEPELLFMDEPFGALDTHTKLELHRELLAAWDLSRPTVVFVTHDLSEAITLADRIIVLSRRPSRVKGIHLVALPRPRDVIRLRETEEYAREYREVWRTLGEEFRERPTQPSGGGS